MRWKTWNLLFATFVVLVIGFNNCSETKNMASNKLSSDGEEGLLSSTGDVCEDSALHENEDNRDGRTKFLRGVVMNGLFHGAS